MQKRTGVNFTFNAAPLIAAHKAATALKLSVDTSGAADISAMVAKESALEFNKHLYMESRQNPKRFWHLYRANRVGVPGHQLWKLRTNKFSGANKSAYIEVIFMANTEDLRIQPTNTLTGYERQGVRLPSGKSSIGVRSTKSFKSRRKKHRFPDRRDPGKSYRWPTQLQDVEFGRRVVINPRHNTNEGQGRKAGQKKGYKQRGGWLAIPTRGMGMVFAKQRVIDYTTWPSYGAFSLEWDTFFANYEDTMKERFEDIVQENLINIEEAVHKVSAPMLAHARAVAAKEAIGRTGGVTIVRPHGNYQGSMELEFEKIWGRYAPK